MINNVLGIRDGETTIGKVMARHRGIGPGFDLLRITLALYIFYGHALWIAGGATSVTGVQGLGTAVTKAVANDGFSGWTRPFHVAAVPVFFALSGFLVIGSAMRLRATSTFLAFRFLRIFPALVVETLLCAFLLGGALTTLTLSGYFSDPLFLRYLGNTLGFISFHLPGVFIGNPATDIVNVNLWTLPAEFYCYLITAALMLSRIIYNRNLYSVIFAIITFEFIALSLATGFLVTDGILSPIAITYYFFTGVFLFHWQDKIPAHWGIFLASGIVGYVLLLFKESVFLAPLPVSYCMVFVGLVAIPKLPLISRGDYSYGIYLYGFPICQALVVVAPDLFVGHGYRLLAIAGLVTCAFAAFSWHMVEHNALQLKRHLSPRWFPKPGKVVRQSPEGRVHQAEVPVSI